MRNRYVAGHIGFPWANIGALPLTERLCEEEPLFLKGGMDHEAGNGNDSCADGASPGGP
jgi:hypothetical protein